MRSCEVAIIWPDIIYKSGCFTRKRFNFSNFDKKLTPPWSCPPQHGTGSRCVEFPPGGPWVAKNKSKKKISLRLQIWEDVVVFSYLPINFLGYTSFWVSAQKWIVEFNTQYCQPYCQNPSVHVLVSVQTAQPCTESSSNTPSCLNSSQPLWSRNICPSVAYNVKMGGVGLAGINNPKHYLIYKSKFQLKKKCGSEALLIFFVIYNPTWLWYICSNKSAGVEPLTYPEFNCTSVELAFHSSIRCTA